MINRILSLSIAVLCVYLVTGALMPGNEKTAPEADTSAATVSESDQMPAEPPVEGSQSQPIDEKPTAIRSAADSVEDKAVGVLQDEDVLAEPVEIQVSAQPLPASHAQAFKSGTVRPPVPPWPSSGTDTAALLEDIEQYTNY